MGLLARNTEMALAPLRLLVAAAIAGLFLAAAPAQADDASGALFTDQQAASTAQGLEGGQQAPCHQDSKPMIQSFLDGAAALNPPSSTCQVVIAMAACMSNWGVVDNPDEAGCCVYGDPQSTQCADTPSEARAAGISDDPSNAPSLCNTCTQYSWMTPLKTTPVWTSCRQAVDKLAGNFGCAAPSNVGLVGQMQQDMVQEGETDSIGDAVFSILSILFF